MNVGFYWTYHFECEPGTVFSDELDQCVFPFATGPPCGTGGGSGGGLASPRPTPPQPTSITTPRTTTTPKTTSPTTTILETTVQTITSPSVTKNFSCSFQPENCAVHRPCLPGESERVLCNSCYSDGIYVSAFFLCGQEDGKVFDRDNNVCVDDPSLNPNCPLLDTTTPTVAPTTTTTTPPPTTVPITTTNRPTTINITKEFYVHCTLDNLRPSADWITEKFCNQLFLCTPDGRYKGTITLCDNYYECSFSQNGRGGT
ncbi:integumentary mucin C.1-like [Macrobrachium rosenbergii]|uniref:integumentary mucin C.1-like n=1 Tax=Macrobrachium rosenbergii TaxID=79674 RepID=UPI0034D62563